MNDPPVTPARGPGFWLAAVVGWGLILVGVIGYANRRGASDLVLLGVWVVGGNVVHDAVLVPIALVVVIMVARVLREPWRTPVVAGLAATACVLLVAIPLLGGYGRKAHNPSLLPLDYSTAVLAAAGIVWLLALGWLALRLAVTARNQR